MHFTVALVVVEFRDGEVQQMLQAPYSSPQTDGEWGEGGFPAST
jgi:hypothetical protein